jgi:two-component system, OmpR family, alkaline phosphatase synthesis response regulator PhoP
MCCDNSGLKKILIVEDDVSVVDVLLHVLKRKEYQIFVAMDGEQGLEKIEQETPDLVILDLGLPQMPGEEVCKKVRRNERIKNTPIIMLTAKNMDSDKVIGKVIGANHYITKPFDVTELLKVSNDILSMPNS